MARSRTAWLEMADGSVWRGRALGAGGGCVGEVVFTTGMVGYVESLTDPSYAGQILVFTSPLIGNYGIPPAGREDAPDGGFESDRVQVRGVVVCDAPSHPSHHRCVEDLHGWLARAGIPGVAGVDTRAVVTRLRSHGTMPGRLGSTRRGGAAGGGDLLDEDLVPTVSGPVPRTYGEGATHVALLDCGMKRSILGALLERGLRVTVLPWDTPADRIGDEFAAVVISNGPGDPVRCRPTIDTVRVLMDRSMPVFGICLGNQIMALAAGAETYKLAYGHRSQNQPCRDRQTDRCIVTSQNHGYAVRAESLPEGWEVWFENLNDHTVEGIRHARGRWRAVQFHPEARPGPVEARYLLDDFARSL